jgi:hypothetical protein
MLYRPLLDIADRGASMGRATSEQRLNMRSIIHLALDNAAPIIDSPISHLWEHRLLFGVTCSASRSPIP